MGTDCHLSGTDVTVSVYRSTLQASRRYCREENEQPYSPGLHDLSAREVYLASECHHRNGELLPPLFTLTLTMSKTFFIGGLFSAALSVPDQFPERILPVRKHGYSMLPGLSSLTFTNVKSERQSAC